MRRSAFTSRPLSIDIAIEFNLRSHYTYFHASMNYICVVQRILLLGRCIIVELCVVQVVYRCNSRDVHLYTT